MLKPSRRKVFFSFHFERDAWRASQVRNCNIISSLYSRNDFIDAASWEEVKRSGENQIKKWIDDQLHGTSITIVLIGKETSSRKYVLYEIEKSYNNGNTLIGIYIHNVKNQYQQTDPKGENPFSYFYLNNNQENKLSNRIRMYDWIGHDGRSNVSKWIDDAIKNRKTVNV